MTDFSSVFQQPAPRPTAQAVFGIDIPAIEICDIGAMIEGVTRFAPLVEQGLANVNAFEPNAQEFARLKAANRTRYRYFQTFLGAGGPATFHAARYPGCSSLYRADPSIIDLFSTIGASVAGNYTVESTRAVQTTRLDDVPDLPEIDYLKLDVQGAELDVLKGASRALASSVMIECEVEFIPLYKDQPLFGDIQVFLRERGFLFHKFLDISGRAFRPVTPMSFAAMSQALWADAIFVRDFSRLDRFTDDQLLKAAAILMDAYDSHDLAHLLLAEFDRRRNTQIAPRYAQMVLSSPSLKRQYMTHKVSP